MRKIELQGDGAQGLEIGGPLAGRPRQNHEVRAVVERREEPAHVLVAHYAHDGNEPVVVEDLRQRRQDRFRPVGIVRDVGHDRRALIDDLHAPHAARFREAASQQALREREDSERVQLVQGHDGHAGVVDLMPPEHRDGQRLVRRGVVLEVERAPVRGNRDQVDRGLLEHGDESRLSCRGDSTDDVEGVAGGARHDGARLAYDARLLRRDRRDVAAEYLGVIDRDPGDDRQHGIERVGRVKPPAEPHLCDRDIDALLSEVERGHGGGDLEEGRLHLLRSRLEPVDEFHHPFRGDALTAYQNPFGEIDHVR